MKKKVSIRTSLRKLALCVATVAVMATSLVAPAAAAEPSIEPAEVVGYVVDRFYPELASKDFNSQVDGLLANGAIMSGEAIVLKQNKCPRSMTWRMLLPLFGVYPYPGELAAPDMPTLKGCTGVYHDSRVAAYLTGLATKEQVEHPTYRAKKAEFEALWTNLCSGNYKALQMPASMAAESDIPYLADLAMTKNTVSGRNAMLVAFPQLKATLGKYLNRFEEQGWNIKVSPMADANGWDARWGDRNVSGGLCVYGQKTLYLNNATPKTLWHEFAHYLARELDIADDLSVFFAKEGKAVQPIIGDYSQKNSAEFWADTFGYYFANPELRPALKEAAPLTVGIIEDAILATGDTNTFIDTAKYNELVNAAR